MPSSRVPVELGVLPDGEPDALYGQGSWLCEGWWAGAGHIEPIVAPDSLRGGLGVPVLQDAPLLLLLLFEAPPTPGEPATPLPVPRPSQEPSIANGQDTSN